MDKLDPYVTDGKLFGDGASIGQSQIGKATYHIKIGIFHLKTFPTDFLWIKLFSQDLLWIDLILMYHMVNYFQMGMHMGSHNLARPHGR